MIRVVLLVLFVAAQVAGLRTATAKKARPRLHPMKAACVHYEVSGSMHKGKVSRCHRRFGFEQYEIRKTSISMGGFSQSSHQHVITIGDTIYSIDLKTRRGTKTKNPMYEGLVKGMKGKSAKQMADAFISGMGFEKTGESKRIAGRKCTVYASAQAGTACLTSKGLMLEQNVMGMKMLAVKVQSNGGPAANYQLHKTVPISAGPDLSKVRGLQDLMKMKRQRPNQ